MLYSVIMMITKQKKCHYIALCFDFLMILDYIDIMMTYRKMHGLGNDFIICDIRNGGAKPEAEFIRNISDRRFGIGCDQFIILEKGSGIDTNNPIELKIYNQDASEAGACGNAMRCVARVYFEQYPDRGNGFIKTPTRLLEIEKAETAHHYSVNMGQALFDWQNIPLSHDVTAQEWRAMIADYDKNIADRLQHILPVSMGNPHLVLFFDDISDIDITAIGKYCEHHHFFPNKANIEFVQIMHDNNVRMRVWERGAGITLACGSGACAVFAALQKLGLGNAMGVNIQLDGGDLFIYGSADDIWMQGATADIAYLDITLK